MSKFVILDVILFCLPVTKHSPTPTQLVLTHNPSLLSLGSVLISPSSAVVFYVTFFTPFKRLLYSNVYFQMRHRVCILYHLFLQNTYGLVLGKLRRTFAHLFSTITTLTFHNKMQYSNLYTGPPRYQQFLYSIHLSALARYITTYR